MQSHNPKCRGDISYTIKPQKGRKPRKQRSKLNKKTTERSLVLKKVEN